MVKKKKKNRNGQRKICNICLNQYQSLNLDKHMHSRVHHEAIERLKGGKQTHMCWACDVSVPGLEQFSEHIETQEHKSQLFSLKQRRERGFTVGYNNDELTALCFQRDQQRSLLKLQKHGKAAKFSESQTQELNNEAAQTVGWNSFRWWTSKSVTWSMKDNVDFTSDELAHSDIFSSWKEYELRQSQHASRQQDEVRMDPKRSGDTHTSDPPPVKRQCLRDVPSTMPRFTSSVSGEKVKCVSLRSTSAAAPLRTLGLLQTRADRLCAMLKNIHNSLKPVHLSVGSSEGPDSQLRPAPDDGLKPNDHGEEMRPFSKKCPQEASIKPEKCKVQTKTQSSPFKQQDGLPASGADPQKSPEGSQPRLVLPTLLSRSVSKTKATKPNLKVARGIRTSLKPSQAAESRVLKPALQKLISSKSSQWRVNWKEIYQEATHRKLQREKGMPRFGIELVTPPPPDSRGLEAEELAHFELDEGFQWSSVECDTVTPPCTVNPSSKDPCRFPPAETCPSERQGHGQTADTTGHTSRPTEQKKDVGEDPSTSGMSRSSPFAPQDRLVCVKAEKSDDYCTKPMQEKADHDRIQSQKKQDLTNTDTLNKNLPKSQVNELLAMSLRENELSSCLEDVDGRLLRAQAVLQTAFIEVQRLQMIKQQVTAEMSSLRIKCIDILQRIKGFRSDPSSDADSAIQAHQKAAGSSGQRQDTALDRTSSLCSTVTHTKMDALVQ